MFCFVYKIETVYHMEVRVLLFIYKIFLLILDVTLAKA